MFRSNNKYIDLNSIGIFNVYSAVAQEDSFCLVKFFESFFL